MKKRPQQDCGGMFTQVQASVEIPSEQYLHFKLQ